jgi:Helix-turn-helix domain
MATKQKQTRKGQTPGTMHIDKRAERILREAVSDGPDDELLTTEEVAAWLGISIQWLEIARGRGTGPAFQVLSKRSIRYQRGTVRAWLKRRSHQSTGEYMR